MLDIIVQNKNVLDSLQKALVLQNANVSNFLTEGYKRVDWQFESVFVSELQGGKNPVKSPTSTRMGSSAVDFTQGKLAEGDQLSLAIVGNGFFVAQDPYNEFTENSRIYLRKGRFRLSANGKYVVDSKGRILMGYKYNERTQSFDENTLVPVQVEGLDDVGFINDGALISGYTDYKEKMEESSTETIVPNFKYKVAVAKFNNQQNLDIREGGAFAPSNSTGPPNNISVSGKEGMGTVVENQIEMSNVSIIEESINQILLQRQFNAVDSVAANASKILTQFIQSVAS